MRPGDWICPGCSNHNYASRAACYRCQLPKHTAVVWGGSANGGNTQLAGIGGMGAAAVVSMSGGTPTNSAASSGGIDMRPGDWLCQVCSNHNYASKQACNRCATPKGLTTAAHGVKQLRPGDWLCDGPGGCNNVNFASRRQCNKCGRDKPASSTSVSASAATAGMAGTANVRAGDWGCVKCGNHNYASRTACNKCQEPKPPPSASATASEGGAGLSAGLHGSVGVNDWICGDTNCCNVNYGFRTVCNKCGSAKPAVVETLAAAPAAGTTSLSATTSTATVVADTTPPFEGLGDLSIPQTTAVAGPDAKPASTGVEPDSISSATAEHTSTANSRKRPNLNTGGQGADSSATAQSSAGADTLARSSVSSECTRDGSVHSGGEFDDEAGPPDEQTNDRQTSPQTSSVAKRMKLNQ